MLYIVAPAVLMLVAGAMVGGFASPFARAGSAAKIGWWAAGAVAVTAVAAVVAAIALPDVPVLNGPIGATCPDTNSTSYDVLTGFVAASVAAGVAVVAAATVEGLKRAATGATFGRVALGILVPYVALGAMLVPALCDYS
jgi:hypothetical protein